MVGEIIGIGLNKLSEGTSWETPAAKRNRLAADAQIAANRQAEAQANLAETQAAMTDAQWDVTRKLIKNIEEKNELRAQQEKHNRWAGAALTKWKNKEPIAAAAEINRSFQDPNFKEYIDHLTDNAGIQAFEPLDLNNKDQRETLTRRVLNKAGLKMEEIDPKKLENLVQELANSRFFIGKTPNGYHMLPVSAVAALSGYGDGVPVEKLKEIKNWDAQALELENDEKALRSILELFVPKEKSKDGEETEWDKITARGIKNRQRVEEAVKNGTLTPQEGNQALMYIHNKDFPDGIPALAGLLNKAENDPEHIQKVARAQEAGKGQGILANAYDIEYNKAAGAGDGANASWVNKLTVARKLVPLKPEDEKASVMAWLGVNTNSNANNYWAADKNTFDGATIISRAANKVFKDTGIDVLGLSVQSPEEIDALLKMADEIDALVQADPRLRSMFGILANQWRLKAGGAAAQIGKTSRSTSAMRTFLNGKSPADLAKTLSGGIGPIDNTAVWLSKFSDIFGYTNEIKATDAMKVLLTALKDNDEAVPKELEGFIKGEKLTGQHVKLILETLRTATASNITSVGNISGGSMAFYAEDSNRAMLRDNTLMLKFLDSVIQPSKQLAVQSPAPPEASEDGVLTRNINWGANVGKKLIDWIGR